MLRDNNIRQFLAFLGILLVLPSSPLAARTRKGDKFLKQAQIAETRQEYEKALDLYSQALGQDPGDAAYQLGARRVRFQVSMIHVNAGEKLLGSGQLQEALVEFQKAYAVDPGSAIAIQEIRRTTEALQANQRGNVPPAEQKLTLAQRAEADAKQRMEGILPVPELRPITNQISTLKMNNQPPKVLYETVGKLAGINVIFDPQYSPPQKNINLDLTNSTLEEALNYIALLTKTFWKPISANAIFVADDNVTKRRDYEDQAVKAFYLKNMTSVQEFQEIVTAVRSLTDIRRMFTYAAQNVVVARGTVDQIALAEKLFHDLDKPKSEVVIDVVVMEVNSDRSRQLAAGLTSGSTVGLVVPVGFTPRASIALGSTTTTGTGTGTGVGTGTTSVSTATTGTSTTSTGTSTGTSTSINLSNVGHVGLSDFSLNLPGALLQAVLSDSATKIMQSPELRASDGQKVSLKIGEKVPYASGSFQPGVGTVGVSPLVSTQFQFAETGVNVELTPHVHGEEEISMHIIVDISNVSRTVNLGGLDQPVIAQRKNEADIRVRNGEVSLVGGLINNQDTSSYSGIPGFVNVPVLGRFLLGSDSKDKSRSNLLIALIPHIVRSPSIEASDIRGIASGTDQTIHLEYAPRKDAGASAETANMPAGSTPPPPGAPIVTPNGPSPLLPGMPSAAPVPGGPMALVITPPAPTLPLSAGAALSVTVQNAADLFSVPIHLKWDPKVLRLNQVVPGALFGDGKSIAPSVDIRNDSGDATIRIARSPGMPGVNGSGPVFTLNFSAIGKGSTTLSITEPALQNSQGRTLPIGPSSTVITVQ